MNVDEIRGRALMMQEGIGTILTENTRDFADVREVAAVNPFA